MSLTSGSSRGTSAAIAAISGLLAAMPGPSWARECTGGTCSQMRSCEQAVYEDYVCGEGRLDRDGDGIPCEKLCTSGAVERAKAALGLTQE